MIQKLENDLLIVEASSWGAELQSIRDKRTGHEYLWQGNPAFWKRRSPVLFPIVGSVWDGKFHMDGKEFAMGQHGFARDMEFTPVEGTPDDEMWFRLEWTAETLERYPRKFRLEIGYKLYEIRLSVMWRVYNEDDRDMAFQIGAHPAFNLPGFNAADPVHGYFAFDTTELKSEVIAGKGCVGKELKEITIDGNLLPIEPDTFRNDALILGGGKVHRVSLLDKERHPYLTVLFPAPYVGLWAPKPDAPFVCIEPWWGRADDYGFTGDFRRKVAVNTLEPGKRADFEYMILIDNI